MERIKQAIEKVKAQQSGRAERAQVSAENLKVARGLSTPRGADELLDISYQYTRVVKLQTGLLQQNRIVAFNKNDPKSMSFDLLRTHILQKMEENGWRTLAITSPTPESGKTVVAINLAMSIAQQTTRTSMLVDLDLRRPKVGTYLGIPTEKSLNDVLDGTIALQDALINPGVPRIVVLPTGRPVRNSSETLSSKNVVELVKELRARYSSRIVIFDLPPLLVADDAIVLLPQVDCVLMVVANGMSTRKEIEDSLRLIPKEKHIGTVLNKADVELVPYYYD